ncbi:unnamed protein product [Arctia plantaginis]|uniref:Uncharacterized protein n=1 Tax=Arctia plantaginis TaxID=874455 RepID=A0A8S0ZDF0_ARCPL|nr:unnamed protein product [Arctia plantaginis]CAB3257093.1 unnamed protein product [Arctia plantaginis]
MDSILFFDNGRQSEIETFYECSQRYRDYYRGYPKAYHPLTYFTDPELEFQCPQDITTVYLSYPSYHVKYKQPIVLPNNIGRTTPIPALPDRTLAGRYNKAACKLFVR